MGWSNKRARTHPATVPRIDILGAIFNLPTPRQIELAKRRTLQSPKVTVRSRSSGHQRGVATIFDFSSDTDEDEDDEEDDSNPDPDSDGDSDSDDESSTDSISSAVETSSSSPSPPRSRKEQRTSSSCCKAKRPTAPDVLPLYARRKLSKKGSKPKQPPALPTCFKASSKRPSPSKPPVLHLSKSSHSERKLSPMSIGTAQPDEALVGPSPTPMVQPPQLLQPHFPWAYAATPAPNHFPFYPAPRTTHVSSPMDCAFPSQLATAYPVAKLSGIASNKTPKSNSAAQEIQHIQSRIDNKVAELAKDADNSELEGQLFVLQAELNMTLNSMMSRPNESDKGPQSFAIPQEIPLSIGHNHSLPSQRSMLHHQDRTSKVNQDDGSSHLEQASLQIHQEGSSVVKQRDTSPERGMRHHLCSGCGCIRSVKFHLKHPLISGRKLVLNDCDKCRETKLENGVIEHHHFCYRCGIARSKAFHRAKPAKSGNPLIPNYCSPCTEEIRAMECIAEASSVGFVSWISASKNGLALIQPLGSGG